MKRIAILCLLVVIAVVFAACDQSNGDGSEFQETVPKGSLKIPDYYKSLEELSSASEVIVSITVGEQLERIEYTESLIFYVTEVIINKVIKGIDLNETKTLKILQTWANEDPLLMEGERKILFLRQHEGSLAENAYICTGLYQGNYSIDEKNKVSLTYTVDEGTLDFANQILVDSFYETLLEMADE